MHISGLIYEITGCHRHRKHVSSHIQDLKKKLGWPSAVEYTSLKRLPTISNQQPGADFVSMLDAFTLAFEAPRSESVISELFCNSSLPPCLVKSQLPTMGQDSPKYHVSLLRPHIRPKIQGSPLRSDSSIPFDGSQKPDDVTSPSFALYSGLVFDCAFLSLMAVSRQIRAEAVSVLESCHGSVHSHNSLYLLQGMCPQLGLESRMRIRTIHVDFIETLETQSTDELATSGSFITDQFPNLECLHLFLVPLTDRMTPRWEGTKTLSFLNSFQDMTATVKLELRFIHDCEFFEREYVSKRGWVCTGGDQVPGISP